MPTVSIRHTPHVYEQFGEIRGDRPTLIFIHGWLLSRHHWRPLAQALAPDYASVIYDLRGFGDSQPDPDAATADYTLAAYAEDVLALIEQLNLGQVWLIGHSLGGSVALWGADLDRDRVQGVICLNAGGGIYLKDEFEKFRNVGQQLVKFRAPWLAKLPGIDWVFARDSVAQPIGRTWGRQRAIDFVTANAEAARGTLLESTTEAEVHRLPQIVAGLPQPVYFIAGAQDTIMEPQYVHHLASFHRLYQREDTPRSNLVELPQCGHFAMLEATATVAELITQKIQPQRDAAYPTPELA